MYDSQGSFFGFGILLTLGVAALAADPPPTGASVAGARIVDPAPAGSLLPAAVPAGVDADKLGLADPAAAVAPARFRLERVGDKAWVLPAEDELTGLPAAETRWTLAGDGRFELDRLAVSLESAAPWQPADDHAPLTVWSAADGAIATASAGGVLTLSGVSAVTVRGTGKGVAASGQTFGVTRSAGGQTLRGPGAWAWFAPPEDPASRGMGVAVTPLAGTTLKIDGTTLRLDGRREIAAIACPSVEAAQRLRHRLHRPLVMSAAEGEQGVYVGSLRGGEVAVRVADRDGDGPEFEDDVWAAGRPGGDRWLIAAFSRANAMARAGYFSAETDQPLAVAIDERGGPKLDVGRAALASVGAIDTANQDATAAGGDALAAKATLLDADGDGVLLAGHLLEGGTLPSGVLAPAGRDRLRAWDLNADGRCDVFDYGHGKYLFNFTGAFHDLFALELDPASGGVSVRSQGGYDLQGFGSMFSKTSHASRFIDGAYRGFEEHFFVDVGPGEVEGLPDGGNFFYYTIDAGDVNRMTMGRLEDRDALRAWAIELDPTPANPRQTFSHVERWQVPGGELALNSISVPASWDGAPLDARGMLRGWYDMAEGVYATSRLQATFAPQGSPMGASEGMYGGSLTTQERIEIDDDGGTYVLYFSPLMGDLHLKGADFGSYAVPSQTPDFFLDINRYYHREAHEGPAKYVGAEPAIRFRQREAKRLEGPVYLTYADRNGDGYFDTYLYDQDNDGLYERRLQHDPSAKTLRLTDGDRTAVWPEAVEHDEVEYLPENYAEVGALYRRGAGAAPRVVTTTLGSSGTPMNVETDPVYRESIPTFFATFGPSWTPVVACDAAHAAEGRYRWTDFGPSGLSRVGSMFVEAGFRQATVHDPWSSGSLEGVDVLVVADLDRTPTDESLAALEQWVRDGGIVIFSTPQGPANRLRQNALGERLGYSLDAEGLQRRTTLFRWASLGPINDPTTRAAEHRRPGPWNRVERFDDPQGLGLLEGLDFLSFVAFPLETGDDFVPLLTYDGRTLMASRSLGDGRVVVSGADWWTNRYIWHHESYEAGTDNDRLLQRLVEWVATLRPGLAVSSLEVGDDFRRLEVEGRGGTVWLARRYAPTATGLARIGNEIDVPPRTARRLLVNGEAIDARRDGVLYRLELPAGRHRVELLYPTEAP